MNLDGTTLTRATRLNKAAAVTSSSVPPEIQRTPWPTNQPLATATDLAANPEIDSDERPATTDSVEATPEELIVSDRLPPFPVPWRHPIRCVAWLIRTTFGLASLTLLLALIAAVPLVNFWVLGYFLDVSGRVGRERKLRAAFPLLGLAPRFGSIVLGTTLCLLPLMLLSGAAADVRWIDFGGAQAARWQFMLNAASCLMVVHLSMALARGGSLTCFVRPIKNFRWLLARWRDNDYWQRASTAIGQFVSGLNAREYFSKGSRGFAGALAWLFIPSAFYSSLRNTDRPGEVIVMLIGGAGLWLTLMWVPLLQTRFAAENHLRVFRELGTARELFRRAPFAWLLAIVLTYVLALPLYLFKALSPPQDAMAFITIIFVVTLFPARVALGWAYQRSLKRPDRAWWPWRLLCKTLLSALVAVYVFLLFFTPAIGEHGRRVLFEHHSWLLPVPF